MPGQVMRAGQASSQAAPSFPSQLATRVGRFAPCPGRQEKKTLPCDEATGRLDWKRSSSHSTACAYQRGIASLAQASPKCKTATPTPRGASHTCAAPDQARGVCLQGRSRHGELGLCRTLPCRHLSLLPRQLRITGNRSFPSIRIEIFFKGMSPPNGNNFLLHFQPSVLNIKRELIEHI